jgi:hypothetical protein
MNEAMLIIVFCCLLLCSQFLYARMKKPQKHFFSIGAAIALLVLVWLFSGSASFGPKVLLTALALTSIYKNGLSLTQIK